MVQAVDRWRSGRQREHFDELRPGEVVPDTLWVFRVVAFDAAQVVDVEALGFGGCRGVDRDVRNTRNGWAGFGGMRTRDAERREGGDDDVSHLPALPAD